MRFVFEQCRQLIFRPLEQIVADDHNGDAGRAEILLRTRIDQAELSYVQRLGHDVARHIRYERNVSGLRKLLPLGAEDRIVRCDVQISGVVFDFQFG